MKCLKKDKDKADLSFSMDELLIINAALNEVCNGIDVFEFDTRIGFSKEQVSLFLEAINKLIDELEKLN